MRQQPDATQGHVPRPGETWRPVADRPTVLTVHLAEARRARAHVPPGLRVVEMPRGRTPACVFLSRYGPGSTLEYSELVVMPASARGAGTWGMWVSHIYVDSGLSVEGGQAVFGLPKELAEFAWESGTPGSAVVTRGGQALARLAWGRPALAIPLPMRGRALSLRGGEVMTAAHALRGRGGPTRVALTIPPNSPLAALGLGRPLLGIVAAAMRGAMGLDQRVHGRQR
ncbi:MAG: acetoacetate decarboxylase family protein [Chthonomonadales bacterium]|nr:acetoacetate decarboxylase family protein [Chthonomonadales bacterium]